MGPEPTEMTVRLREVDADVLLAAAEAVINKHVPLGPGLHHRNLEEAARRVEAVADLWRKGIRDA